MIIWSYEHLKSSSGAEVGCQNLLETLGGRNVEQKSTELADELIVSVKCLNTGHGSFI
jgi:hypothetical protein